MAFHASRRLRRAAARSACTGLSIWPLFCAVAQSTLPSQVVPGSLRPPTTDSAAPTELRQRPSSDPTDAAPQGPRVTLARIDVVGGFPTLVDAAQSVAQTLRGRAVSMIDIQRAATALERAYNDAGYVLARVIVPPQQLVDGGSLTLRVIDGFIEEVVVDAVPEALRTPVRERLLRLVGQAQLTSAQLEREVLLAGELPGLHLRSALVRGTREGGTRLVVESGFVPMALQAQLDQDPAAHGVFLSTAHPAKFREVVEPAIGTSIELPQVLADAIARPRRSVSMPAEYGALVAFLRS